MLKIVKNMKNADSGVPALPMLLELLAGIPFVQLDRAAICDGPNADGWEIPLRWPGGQTVLICGWSGSGQPAPAKAAIAALQNLLIARPQAVGVLVAPYISHRVATMCRQRGIGAVDCSGNAWLTFGNCFIERTGRPNRFSEARELKSVFTPKSSRILRVLLENPRTAWLMQDLSREAAVSVGTVAAVKQGLSAMDQLADNRRVLLANPAAVLTQWAASRPNFEQSQLECYTTLAPDEVLGKLAGYAKSCDVRFALCGLTAAWRLTPMVRSPRSTVYLLDDLATAAEMVGLKPVSSGGNLVLVRPCDDGVFYRCTERQGLPVTGPVQTFVDCAAIAGRGEEAAEAVADQVLKLTW